MRRFRPGPLPNGHAIRVFAKLRAMEIGTLTGLTLRAARRAPPRPVDCAQALAERGLLDDVHADRYSPRQLLLADSRVYAQLALPPHALRENLLLDVDTATLSSGTVLQVGESVLLRMMFQCEACGNLDAVRPGLARALGGRRGMLARVIAGGTLRPGDRIRDLGPLLPAWSDDWHERVLTVLEALPPGDVIAYSDLARLAGVQSTYCRAFPRMIRNLGPAYAGLAVAAGDPVDAPRWKGEGLFEHAPLLRLI
jgi:alkylated DNA nucleotide flippase Atl1